MTNFLVGNSRFSPADVLACWFDHNDSHLDWDLEYMYSTTTSFKDIKAVWPRFTLFTAQVIGTEMI